MVSYLKKQIKILGSAVSIGQPKKGVEHTPAVLKIERIESLIDPFNAEWIDILNQPKYTIEKFRQAPIRNLPELAKFNKLLYQTIINHANPSEFFLNIGGDHSIGSSTVTALNKVHNNNLAVIWIDAHGDFNTPVTSPSGNYHGMPLAHATGMFKVPTPFDWLEPIPISSVAMIGIRDMDPEEKMLMDEMKLTYFTMQDVRKYGIKDIMDEIMQKIDPHDKKMIHLSLDVDGFDPSLFPGTGTAVKGGLVFDEYKQIIHKIRCCGERFVSMDMVEINLEIEKVITNHNVKELLKITFH